MQSEYDVNDKQLRDMVIGCPSATRVGKYCVHFSQLILVCNHIYFFVCQQLLLSIEIKKCYKMIYTLAHVFSSVRNTLKVFFVASKRYNVHFYVAVLSVLNSTPKNIQYSFK